MPVVEEGSLALYLKEIGKPTTEFRKGSLLLPVFIKATRMLLRLWLGKSPFCGQRST